MSDITASEAGRLSWAGMTAEQRSERTKGWAAQRLADRQRRMREVIDGVGVELTADTWEKLFRASGNASKAWVAKNSQPSWAARSYGTSCAQPHLQRYRFA